MNIGIIGRSELLYNTAEYLIDKGHTIKLIITAKEAPEYTKTSDDFERLANKVGAEYLFTNKIDEQDRINNWNFTIQPGINCRIIISFLHWWMNQRKESVTFSQG